MKIRHCQSRPGRLVRSTIEIGGQGSGVELPLWIASGRRTGKTMFLSAGIHGDEINAIAIGQRFVHELALSDLTGQLLFVPIANVSGYRQQTRTVPEDGKDLNRCFPGNIRGTASEQIAHFIFSELLPLADFGVDVHDSGHGSVLLPHARIHDDGLLELAAVFGTDIVMKATLPPGYRGILSIEARKRFRRPFFHVEVGGSTILWEGFIEQGVMGLQNLLIHEGMLPGKMVLPKYQFFLAGRDDLAAHAPIEGLLTQHVSLGQAVAKGEKLATIVNPLTRERVVIRARECGVVHDLNVHAKVNADDDVVGLMGFGACEQNSAVPRLRDIQMRLNNPTNTNPDPEIANRVARVSPNLFPSLRASKSPKLTAPFSG